MKHLFIASLIVLAACGGDPKPVDSPNKTVDPPLTNGGETTAPPSSGEVAKGTAALTDGKLPEARAAFEAAIKKNPKQADAHYYLGLTFDRMGDKGGAQKEYQTALDLSPDMTEAAANLVAVLTEAQRYDEAVAIAKKTLAKNPKSAELTLNLAVALAGKGDQEAAIKAFDDAVKASPNDARVYLAYGEQLSAWKRRDEAIAKLKQGLDVAKDDPALIGSIGFAFRTERAAPECVAAFDKAIAIKDNADFRTNRALCKLASKDRAGATSDLKEATTKESTFPVAHYWYGLMLHEDGKFPEAQKEYEAYLKLAPNGPMSKMATMKLVLAKDKKKPEKKP